MHGNVPFVSDPSCHTMEKYLYRYVAIKIHPAIESFKGNSIIVCGNYERKKSIISCKEKSDKLFNWKRPTVELEKGNGNLFVNCFPGIDYVYHYAALIKSYFELNNIKAPEVLTDVPSKIETLNQLNRSNLREMPLTDIVIFGKVESLSICNNKISWEGDGDFLWSRFQYEGKRITLLGCKFSIWGDVAGALVRLLGQRGVKTFIYTGKVGGLKNNMCPNQNLATGNSSSLNNKAIMWNNVIKLPSDTPNVIIGKHINLFSPIGETKAWHKAVEKEFSFVDPEIGYMGYEAQQNNMSFGYIHLISDNIAAMGNENLSNERNKEVIYKRRIADKCISSILEYSLKELV
jgi:hypothetical protein